MTGCTLCKVKFKVPERDFEDGLDFICLDCCQGIYSKPMTFTCQICLSGDLPIEELKMTETLDKTCNHLFCRDCLSQYITNFLKSGFSPQNLQFRCPGQLCKSHLSASQVENIMSDSQKKLLQKTQLLAFTPEFYLKDKKDLKTEVLLFCPDCHEYACFQSLADPFNCLLCQSKTNEILTRCALCWSKGHSGATCQVKNEVYLDQMFEELIESHVVVRCPSCQYSVQKNEGCNAMTCRSPICKGNTTFCYGCGINFLNHTTGPLCHRA